MRRLGFSAIDALLTIGVIAITAGVSVPMYRNFQIRSDLDVAVAQTLHGLSRAQLLSQTGQEDGAWGFHVPSGTIFMGEAYLVRDTGLDETIPLPESITASGIEEVLFSRVYGVPSPTGDIILEAPNGERRTVTISADGTLDASGIESGDAGGLDGEDTGGDTGSTSGDTGSTSGDTGSTAGDTGDTGSTSGEDTGGNDGGDTGDTGDTGSDSGENGGTGGSTGGEGDDDDEITCEDRFSVAADGTVETTGTVNLTVKALGSAITYGAGGPEVQVRADISTNNGATWSDLFGDAEIDGGEEQTLANITSGQQILLRVNGRYGWLFNTTYKSNDASGHIVVLRDGETPPNVDAFDNQGSLTSFLNNIIADNGTIDIGEYDAVMLVELGSLNSSSADFQDAVILFKFEQEVGSCADANDPRFNIAFERLQNSGQGDAENVVYVGQEQWAYADAQWIPLLSADDQVATDAGLVETAHGIAVERKSDHIRVLLHGSHSGNNNKEIIDARITFEGATISSITNDTSDNNATEAPFDAVVNDGSGGDEVTWQAGATSAFFQARVTSADDAILIYWQEVVQGDDDDAGGGEDGDDGEANEDDDDGDGDNDDGDAGNESDDDDDGNGDDDDGVASNDEDDNGDGDDDDGIACNGISDQCKAGFTINNGRIVLQEKADVSFRVLGSHSRYGSENGPEIEVRLNASINGGSTWKSLFGYRDVDGNELDILRDVPAGAEIILEAQGRRGWLYRRTANTSDSSGRLKLLTHENDDPGTTPYLTPAKLQSFVRSKFTQRKAHLRSKEVLILGELQDVTTSSDYQDLALLVIIEKPASRGICGASESTGDASSAASGGATSGASSSAGSGGSSSSEAQYEICHFPPGNPRNHETTTVGASAWPAHAGHGDHRGACEGDEDGDGVTNSTDLCPGTYLPESVPTEYMLFSKYALTNNSDVFRVGPRRTVSDFTLADTAGCSCEQLIDVAEDVRPYRFAQFPWLHRNLKSLWPFYTEGARRFGCGKAVLQLVKKNAACLLNENACN